jgi:iron complex outermembrane receptor protein
VLDEDPPVCQSCGSQGFNPVVHDIPGRVGYVRVSYQPQ